MGKRPVQEEISIRFELEHAGLDFLAIDLLAAAGVSLEPTTQPPVQSWIYTLTDGTTGYATSARDAARMAMLELRTRVVESVQKLQRKDERIKELDITISRLQAKLKSLEKR